MKRIYLLLIVFTLLFSISLTSQEKKIDSVYTNYFENTREIPYLHLNKTSFIKGEEVWFQAYIIEQNSNKLHPTTSNLYVSIFEENGEMKEQHLVKIENGIGRGNFLIDSTFKKNNYYLKASTNWMKNFKEDNSFYQKIKVIASTDDNIVTKISTLEEKYFFDFQLFPESGHFLSNTNNSIGILIKNAENKGIEIVRGLIKNTDDKVIKSFATNKFGLGKTSLFIERDKTYILEAELPNGSIIKKKISKTRNIGMLLKVLEQKENFEIIIETNLATLKLLKNKTYKVLIHNTRKYKNLTLTFNDATKKYMLLIDKKELPKGINIITLFNEENNPISERLIFNHSKDLFADITVHENKRNKDSVSIEIKNNSNDIINLSASFLPKNTKAYNAQNNIIASFLLKPYVRGKIENTAYYFDNINENRYKDLDILLITQGWSKYNWSTIFRTAPSTKYTFENGIDVKFTLNQQLSKNESLLIISKENGFLRQVKNNELPVTIKNLFLKKESGFNFTLQRGKDALKISPSISYSSSTLTDFFNSKELITTKKKKYELSVFNSLKDYNILDEVVIISKKKPDNKITNAMALSFQKVDLNTSVFTGDMLEQIIDSMIRYYEYSNNPLRIVFINNMPVSRNTLINLDISKEQIREIRLGIIALNERAVHIYTYSSNEFRTINFKSNQIQIPVGFARSKEYYSPKYPSFSEQTYTDYGAIFWKSNITLQPFSSIDFKFPVNNQKIIKYFIEGVSISGKVISEKSTLQ